MIKGIRTCARTGKESEVDIEWKTVTKNDGRRALYLLNGVTGYEGFYIEDGNLELMSQRGWTACMGTKDIYDRLVIPAEEMMKIYNALEEDKEK